MGARLAYLKVIDRELFYIRGGRVQPGLHNLVVLRDEPGPAATFLVLRGWTDDHGTFTEQWRIESPGGETVFESLPREIHLASESHIERLEDELADIEFSYSADNYTVVLTLDDNEVARADFVVQTNERS
jgi:hypothetical protein